MSIQPYMRGMSMPASRLPQKRGARSTDIRAPEESRPSVTNSHLASLIFERFGIGVAAYAKIVLEAATAEMSIYNKFGKEIAKVPDQKARQWAGEQIRDVFGCKFAPEQKQESVPIQFVQIIQELERTPYRDLADEARRLKLDDFNHS